MKEAYKRAPRIWSPTKLRLIPICDEIVTEYANKGFKLTVRQVYYQLVARGHVENNIRSYNNVQAMLNEARESGLIDWDAIEDRTRGVIERAHWGSGTEILDACAQSYHEDLWQDQNNRVFLIVEKEALAGVFEPICREYDIPMLPARGYPSASTLREFAKARIMRASQQIVILHFGDHDPSGIDMSRDLEERLMMFSRNRTYIDFRRIALNMDQVEEQSPPPNPAKTTDSRYQKYRDEFGDESWELDALSPEYLHSLVSSSVDELIDIDKWEKRQLHIEDVRKKLKTVADNFNNEGIE
jgi:hypothetical protein